MKNIRNSILVIAAHADDEVLGAGGTIAKFSKTNDINVLILSESSSAQFHDSTRMKEKKQKQAIKAAGILGVKEVFFANLPDQKLACLPTLDLNQCIESFLNKLKPSVIYTHHFADLNEDHRVVYEATSVASRPFTYSQLKALYMYRVDPILHAGFGSANFNYFEDISKTINLKLRAMQAYKTENRYFPHYRSLEAIKYTAYHYGSMVGIKACEPFQLTLGVNR